jgi:pantoate--beta-alanine ligase
LKIVRRIAELDHFGRGRVGFVPTMGALHDGHASLMRTARGECDVLVASLFVNPLQFGPGEDFERYPRAEANDSEIARNAGVDVLFIPTVQEVYPRRSTTVSVPELTDRWEGAYRPGHFDGVATVVCKLFNMVAPDVAYFGLKDLQQCAVIRRMVEDLNIRLELRFCATLREADGLAMSSRNAYLTVDQRAVAPLLYRQLLGTATAIASDGQDVDSALAEARMSLEMAGFVPDYFALVSTDDLRPLDEYSPPASLIAAARLGTTRLIDNLQLPR